MIQKSIHQNLIAELNTRFGFSLQQIQHGIAARVAGVDAEGIDIKKWVDNVDTIPKWGHRGAARWIIELWMTERDACTPADLLGVDKKYTATLKGFSMADIIIMRNEIINLNPGRHSFDADCQSPAEE